MTKRELANLLDGRKFPLEFVGDELEDMAESNLVVIWGDDRENVYFAGAIDYSDSLDGHHWDEILFDEDGVIPEWEDIVFELDEEAACNHLRRVDEAVKLIVNSVPFWSFDVFFPCQKFNLYDNGRLFCEGIVINLDSFQDRE